MAGDVIKRAPNGHFLPGTAGGKGRPRGYKGIAKYIQRNSNGCEDLIDFMFQVLKGEVPEGATLQAKQWACEQLLNRGLGKAPAVVEVHQALDSDPAATVIDMSAASDEDLEAMEKAAEVMERLANKRKPIDV